MLLNLLLEESTQNSPDPQGLPGWLVYVVLGVMVVGMILLMVLPNRKRQKEYQQMQNAIRVGAKIMTIGRMIGVITKVYADNTLEVDVGTPGNPVIITISREAIGVNLTAQEEARAAQEAAKAQKAGTQTAVQPVADENSSEVVEGESSENSVESTESTETADTKVEEDDAI